MFESRVCVDDMLGLFGLRRMDCGGECAGVGMADESEFGVGGADRRDDVRAFGRGGAMKAEDDEPGVEAGTIERLRSAISLCLYAYKIRKVRIFVLFFEAVQPMHEFADIVSTVRFITCDANQIPLVCID